MILIIASEKGGVGKSTIAVNLVIQSILEGVDTLLVDADIQGSCNDFSVKRDELEISPRIQVVMKRGKNLHRELTDLKQRYQRIVVDTGGRDSPELRSALLVADAVLIPCRPSQFDLWASERIFSIIDTALDLNANLKPYVLIFQAHTNVNVTSSKDASHFLSEYPHIDLCSTIIYERQIWQRSILEGRSVVEFKSNKARTELKLLYVEIFNG